MTQRADHSSSASMSAAPTRRMSDSREEPCTTRVLRLISRLALSWTLLVRILVRCVAGRPGRRAPPPRPPRARFRRPRDLQHLLGRLLVARPHEDGALLREDGLHGLARLSLVVLPVDAARHVAHEVRDAALPGPPGTSRLSPSPFVGVRDDMTRRTPSTPRALRPERNASTRRGSPTHAVHADEALVARVVEPDRGHDGLGRRAPLHAALHVGGVEPQVGEAHPVEALPPERVHLGVQALAQARHLRLRHRPPPSSPATASTLRVDIPMTYISATAATSASPPCSSARSGPRGRTSLGAASES